MKISNSPIIHPVLFSIFFILFLYSYNGSLNKKVSSYDISSFMSILEKNSFEVDLKRLDESPTANEVSFITSFQLKTQLLELREALYKLDDQLEVTFLDNTKIF